MFKSSRALRKDLGHARQVANEHRVRAMELEENLRDLVAHIEALPTAINYKPSTEAKGLIREGYPIPVRIPALSDPGAPIVLAVRHAKEVLG